jgi:hypothetical protein
MQSAATDKLLNPPQGGGKLQEKSGFRSAERCLRSLSRQNPAISMKFSEEDRIFISKSDRLLARRKLQLLAGNILLKPAADRADIHLPPPNRASANFFALNPAETPNSHLATHCITMANGFCDKQFHPCNTLLPS